MSHVFSFNWGEFYDPPITGYPSPFFCVFDPLKILTYFMINFKVLHFLSLAQYCLIIYLTLYDPPLKCVMPFFNKIFVILVIHNKKLSITEMEPTYL